ncbi:MAG TPA: DUF4870 domain-containing protein [Pyrinomonadaceae bacterium]|jgi:uncharacterized Tic20 family protein|nr:DUF4870 domain-containing protein [Pyrinomonadaceae bacterium]
MSPNLQQPWNNSLQTQTPETRQMGMFIHLSQLLNLLIPFGGVILPIVLWQMKKGESPAIDWHGKMVVNWLLSCLIYGVVSFILAFVLIGFLGFLALAILSIVFPIIGGIKANNGEMWEYPLTIKFLK